MDPLVIVIIGVVLVCSMLSIFFEKLWKAFPFAEKHPLVIWAFVMSFFLLVAVIAGSNDRG